MKRTLRPYLLPVIFFFILSLYAFAPRVSLAEPTTPTIGETFTGETLTYDIGFWFFERVAVAELSLTQEEGGYKAVLKAHTTGFVDKVIQHREDIYTAHLKEVEGGKRFATVSLESSSDVNGKVRYGLKEVDRKDGVFSWHSWGGGKDERKGRASFSPGSYVDDPLGGFYNFRFGVYGKAGPGAELTIKTFPKKDFKDEFIKMKMGPRQKGASDGVAYAARVEMSKDVLGTDLSDIDIYFSPELVPLRAKARDIVFFTDVTGILRNRSKGN